MRTTCGTSMARRAAARTTRPTRASTSSPPCHAGCLKWQCFQTCNGRVDLQAANLRPPSPPRCTQLQGNVAAAAHVHCIVIEMLIRQSRATPLLQGDVHGCPYKTKTLDKDSLRAALQRLRVDPATVEYTVTKAKARHLQLACEMVSRAHTAAPATLASSTPTSAVTRPGSRRWSKQLLGPTLLWPPLQGRWPPGPDAVTHAMGQWRDWVDVTE